MKFGMVVATCLAFALPAYAQTGTQPAPKGQAAPSAATRDFVEKVAISDMFEIQSNKLALDKSNDDAIQKFAQTMIDDHTKTSNELKAMTKDMQGLTLPTELDNQHRQKLQQLQSADGRQFHQVYRTQQVEAHQTAIRLFDSYAKNGDAAELKSWAQKTLPVLKQHLQHAQALPQNPAQVGQAPASGTNPNSTAQKNDRAGRSNVLATASPNQMMASDLRGTTVYGANDENIGEIDDIVLQRDGRVAAVVVGVGGFLGIGEKNVAIPFDALEIQAEGRRNVGTTGTMREGQNGARNTGTIEPERIRLRGMTKQDLENAPRFNADGR